MALKFENGITTDENGTVIGVGDLTGGTPSPSGYIDITNRPGGVNYTGADVNQLSGDQVGLTEQQLADRGVQASGGFPGGANGGNGGAGAGAGDGTDTTGVGYNMDGSRYANDAARELAEYYNANKPKTAAEIAAEEEATRQRYFADQQNAISGINSMYDNLLSQINKDNNARLGSTASINALSGNRGSASGAANEDQTRTANNKVVAANEAERNARISQVMSDYKTKISAEITEARKLRQTDANAWLTYKAGESERNIARAADLRKSFIASRLAPDDIDDKTYQQMADSAGYTISQAKALYKSDYDANLKKFTDEETKRAAEALKLTAETDLINANANAKSDYNMMIKNKYTPVNDVTQLEALKASGKIVVQKGDNWFIAPSTLKTKVVTIGNNQVLVDVTTGEQIKVLGPKPAGSSGGGSGSDKNYTAVTIPADIKGDLLYDKNSGKSIDDLMGAYPEVSTSYIQSLFADPSKLAF